MTKQWEFGDENRPTPRKSLISYVGGGFDASAGQGSGVTSESKPEGIVPMVIKQIHDCPESGLRLYDMVFGTVQLVALVRNIEYTSTKITYVLEDHTGKIEAHIWLEEGDVSKAPQIVVNTYASVYGSVRNQGGTKTLIVFKIEAIKSPNELTTHLLEVLNARFSAEHYATKKNTDVVGHFQMDTTAPKVNQEAQHPLGLTGKELAIYQAIQGNKSESGISFSELERRFSHIPTQELRDIVELMTQEGMCYTSIDADHFKSSDEDGNA
ncbi:Replication protein A 32 kDa subunit [Pseudolycoriella hygida]|uniref:Replication protein A 32 kDa subunit n=1 Tax=Pseudolycoriella hygida TaxID=35572 RepID=A0A9Q0MT12_9DIPT|nr:Replication protein A 32 kDa subunit [Pseudolycoriella hygida]